MELGDILIGSPLPLHPSLSGNPYLSVKVTMNGNFYEMTPFASGDPESGIWEMSGSLNMHVYYWQRYLTDDRGERER